MKLLISSSETYYLQFLEFGKELEKHGIEYKIVKDEWIQPFGRNLLKWIKTKSKFKLIIKEFHPDFVLVDTQALFAKAAIESKIPTIIFLRGNYWEEMKLKKETNPELKTKRHIFWYMKRLGESCLKDSNIILPVCKYLENIVKDHYPDKTTIVLNPGINPELWFSEKGMQLKHPCVGLIQAATIWGKTKEMLILPKILEEMPDVNFYWAGDGPYKDKILSKLEKYDNFKWIGSLDYPDQVRQFLTEMDVYALVSGLDMMPVSLLEAQLMKKPVVATNVGGISETMKENESGFLVEKGDFQGWIEKISIIISDSEKAKSLGESGHMFVKENFNWEVSAKKLVSILQGFMSNHAKETTR